MKDTQENNGLSWVDLKDKVPVQYHDEIEQILSDILVQYVVAGKDPFTKDSKRRKLEMCRNLLLSTTSLLFGGK